MILLITGSRNLKIDDAGSFGAVLEKATPTLYHALDNNDLMIFGDAGGADCGAYNFAILKRIPYERWVAEWNNLYAPGAVIRERQNGSQYNVRAGYDRNQKMVDRAIEVSRLRNENVYCVAMWDEVSTGTDDCMRRAFEAGIKVLCYNPKTGKRVDVSYMKAGAAK